MTPIAIGRILRALRQRLRLRQVDVARRVAVSQSVVSRVERGDLDAASMRTLGRLMQEVGGELVLSVRWRGGELDRLLDRAHAHLVERVAGRLAALGYDVHVEVSFSRFGERGSIDVLGWDPVSLAAVIVEVKSELAAIEETLRRHDVKVRLAPEILRDRFGIAPRLISRLLVLPDTTTARRRVAEHAATFERAYPVRGRAVLDRLQARETGFAGILFERVTREAGAVPVRRVRSRPAAPEQSTRSLG